MKMAILFLLTVPALFVSGITLIGDKFTAITTTWMRTSNFRIFEKLLHTEDQMTVIYVDYFSIPEYGEAGVLVHVHNLREASHDNDYEFSTFEEDLETNIDLRKVMKY